MTRTTDVPTAVAERHEAAARFALSATGTAFFFDVDGTLLEIVPEPGSVVADPDLLGVLAALSTQANGAVALVSGRALADLDRIFSPLVLPAAALHGGEIRFPDGRCKPPPQHAMDHARAPVGRFVADNPGLLLEDKGATLAIHFRRRPELAAAVLGFLNGLGPGDEIAVQEGKLVAELKPVQFNKGTAIAALMEQPPFRGRVPAFFGDDLTDEHGFAYANGAGGVSVRIGAIETPTEARAHFDDPAALRRHLRALLAAAAETSEAQIR
ncbi:MAG TPA: trehalose-phosphatase [Beijerinckiaceae bacterium]|nr:trehalose-phosphatase [Beijerinckiaceae bacterium]